MKVKIAYFAHAKYGYEGVKSDKDFIEDYIRKTEWVEVDLPDLSPAELVNTALPVFAHLKKDALDSYLRTTGIIVDAEAKFLAIAHTPGESPTPDGEASDWGRPVSGTDGGSPSAAEEVGEGPASGEGSTIPF